MAVSLHTKDYYCIVQIRFRKKRCFNGAQNKNFNASLTRSVYLAEKECVVD